VESISAAITAKRIHPLFSQVKTPTGAIIATQPAIFDAGVLPELGACFDADIRAYFRDTQRSLNLLSEVTGDPVLLQVLASRSKVDRYVARHPIMKDLNHDELLLSWAIGYSDAELAKLFLVDSLAARTIRHDLNTRYRTAFRWLEGFKNRAKELGYAAAGKKRKYIDGLKSSNIAKRNQAAEFAVRWLIQF